MGGEALRILHEHPQVEIAWATSRSGQPLEYFHRNLYGADLKLVHPEEVTACDAVFFAVPTGTPMSMAKVWSASAALSKVTFFNVLLAGSMVVSHNCSKFISPRPL